MQQKKIIDIPISSTCFGQLFAHPQERKTAFYSLWYNVPKLLPAGGLEQLGCIIPHVVKQSCAPEDGQKIARNMLSRLEYQ